RLAELPPKKIVASERPVPEELAQFPERVARALDDDLNTPVALAHAASFLKHVNELCDRAAAKGGQIGEAAHAAALEGFRVLDEVLGLGGDDPAAFLERVRDRRARAPGTERRGRGEANAEAA